MADLTIYQRLTKVFGGGGPTQTEPTYQKFKVGSGDILKTDSKADFENFHRLPNLKAGISFLFTYS